MNFKERVEELKRERENKPPLVKWMYSHGFWGYNLYGWTTRLHELPGEAKSRFTSMVGRARKGYGHRDTWSLDYYILSWLPEALEEVADTSMGYPSNYGISDAELATLEHPWDAYDEDRSMQAYLTEIREIAQFFREFREKQEALTETEEDHKEFRKVWKRLGKIFFHLWT